VFIRGEKFFPTESLRQAGRRLHELTRKPDGEPLAAKERKEHKDKQGQEDPRFDKARLQR
jgi:hypothetical protein